MGTATSIAQTTRRWCRPQFRLRTLLVGVTVSAVWLGWYTSQRQRQRRAVGALRALGFTVGYDSRAAGGNAFGSSIRGPSGDRVVTLSVRDVRLTDRHCALLKCLPDLEHLSMAGGAIDISDRGVADLRSLRKMDHVFFVQTRMDWPVVRRAFPRAIISYD